MNNYQPLPNIPISEIPIKKKKTNLGHVILGIFIGIIITVAFVQLELSPQWVKDQTCDEMIMSESLAAYATSIMQETSSLCRTHNSTIIEINSTQYPLWFNYHGTNVSRRYATINDTCDFYLNQGVQNG